MERLWKPPPLEVPDVRTIEGARNDANKSRGKRRGEAGKKELPRVWKHHIISVALQKRVAKVWEAVPERPRHKYISYHPE